MRITLIHANATSIPSIEQAFRRLRPDATLMILLDGSLAPDLARNAILTPAMTERFLILARCAKETRSDAIPLFTCPAFGPCIEACARQDGSHYGRATRNAGDPRLDDRHGPIERAMNGPSYGSACSATHLSTVSCPAAFADATSASNAAMVSSISSLVIG
jgi:hypothetical protein